MSRFYISDGAVPGWRIPVATQRQAAKGRQSDVLNEAQAIGRGRKLVATASPPAGFVMVVDTAKPGSASNQFVLPCNGAGYNASVDWGDGNIQTISGTPGNVTHTYATGGVKSVTISENVVGGFPTIRFNNAGDCQKVMEVARWGTNKWVSFSKTFYGCSNLTITATDSASANTGAVTDFTNAWTGCTSLTSFPLLDTGHGITFGAAWSGCNKLTSFPLLNTGSGTNFSNAWYNCTGLTSFPAINTGLGTNFDHAWGGCNKLTSFPLLNTSNGINFGYAWYNCTGLTSFPSINTSLGTNFDHAWGYCNKLISFPLLDTGNGVNFSSAWFNCAGLTSFPLLNTALGTDFSSAWFGCTKLTVFPTLNMRNMTSGSGCFTGVTLTTASFSSLLNDLVLGTATGVTFDGGASKYDASADAARTTLFARGWSITTGGMG